MITFFHFFILSPSTFKKEKLFIIENFKHTQKQGAKTMTSTQINNEQSAKLVSALALPIPPTLRLLESESHVISYTSILGYMLKS